METIRFIQQFANPFLDQFFVAMTLFGEEIAFMVIFTFCFWCINKEYAYKLGLVYLLSVVLNFGLKEIFRVPRPFGVEGIRYLRVETATGYSFPSGHTQSSATYLTSLMLEYKKKWLTVVGLVIIVLVGISRLYLGAHRPLEVILGGLIGMGWVLLSNRFYPYLQKVSKKLLLGLVFVLIAAGMLLIREADLYKTAGVIVSLLAGCFLEAKYIGYSVKVSWPRQLGKMILGFAVLLLLKSGLKAILPDLLLCHFLRYLFIGFWVTLGAPALFKVIFASTKEVRTLKG